MSEEPNYFYVERFIWNVALFFSVVTLYRIANALDIIAGLAR